MKLVSYKSIAVPEALLDGTISLDDAYDYLMSVGLTRDALSLETTIKAVQVPKGFQAISPNGNIYIGGRFLPGFRTMSSWDEFENYVYGTDTGGLWTITEDPEASEEKDKGANVGKVSERLITNYMDTMVADVTGLIKDGKFEDAMNMIQDYQDEGDKLSIITPTLEQTMNELRGITEVSSMSATEFELAKDLPLEDAENIKEALKSPYLPVSLELKQGKLLVSYTKNISKKDADSKVDLSILRAAMLGAGDSVGYGTLTRDYYGDPYAGDRHRTYPGGLQDLFPAFKNAVSESDSTAFMSILLESMTPRKTEAERFEAAARLSVVIKDVDKALEHGGVIRRISVEEAEEQVKNRAEGLRTALTTLLEARNDIERLGAELDKQKYFARALESFVNGRVLFSTVAELFEDPKDAIAYLNDYCTVLNPLTGRERLVDKADLVSDTLKTNRVMARGGKRASTTKIYGELSPSIATMLSDALPASMAEDMQSVEGNVLDYARKVARKHKESEKDVVAVLKSIPLLSVNNYDTEEIMQFARQSASFGLTYLALQSTSKKNTPEGSENEIVADYFASRLLFDEFSASSGALFAPGQPMSHMLPMGLMAMSRALPYDVKDKKLHWEDKQLRKLLDDAGYVGEPLSVAENPEVEAKLMFQYEKSGAESSYSQALRNSYVRYFRFATFVSEALGKGNRIFSYDDDPVVETEDYNPNEPQSNEELRALSNEIIGSGKQSLINFGVKALTENHDFERLEQAVVERISGIKGVPEEIKNKMKTFYGNVTGALKVPRKHSQIGYHLEHLSQIAPLVSHLQSSDGILDFKILQPEDKHGLLGMRGFFWRDNKGSQHLFGTPSGSTGGAVDFSHIEVSSRNDKITVTPYEAKMGSMLEFADQGSVSPTFAVYDELMHVTKIKNENDQLPKLVFREMRNLNHTTSGHNRVSNVRTHVDGKSKLLAVGVSATGSEERGAGEA